MAARSPARVRKARRATVCPACHAPISVGQQVMSVDRGPWMHAWHPVVTPGGDTYGTGRPPGQARDVTL